MTKRPFTRTSITRPSITRTAVTRSYRLALLAVAACFVLTRGSDNAQNFADRHQ